MTSSYPEYSLQALTEARHWLAARCEVMARAQAATPPVGWRRRPGGFAGLTKMIVEQQVSVAAAAAIWRRVEAGLGCVTPEAVLAFSEPDLKTLGLSAPKVRYVRGLAIAVHSGAFDFDALEALDDADAVEALVALNGVGRWTAETYLMFCHGRFDLFPAADVALQEAVRVAEAAETRRTPKDLAERALVWRPYRSVAAHLLWAYYGAIKRGEAEPPTKP